MSAKCLDHQGRWRGKTIAFRMSPEEDSQLNIFVRPMKLKRPILFTWVQVFFV